MYRKAQVLYYILSKMKHKYTSSFFKHFSSLIQFKLTNQFSIHYTHLEISLTFENIPAKK